MRLIDADAYRLELLVSANPENYGSGCSDYDDGCVSASENMLGILDTFPTVDAKPVVHAHWEHITEQKPVHDKYRGEYIIETPKTRCSKCGKTNKNYAPPYCPHCGAKMDEVV